MRFSPAHDLRDTGGPYRRRSSLRPRHGLDVPREVLARRAARGGLPGQHDRRNDISMGLNGCQECRRATAQRSAEHPRRDHVGASYAKHLFECLEDAAGQPLSCQGGSWPRPTTS